MQSYVRWTSIEMAHLSLYCVVALTYWTNDALCSGDWIIEHDTKAWVRVPVTCQLPLPGQLGHQSHTTNCSLFYFYIQFSLHCQPINNPLGHECVIERMTWGWWLRALPMSWLNVLNYSEASGAKFRDVKSSIALCRLEPENWIILIQNRRCVRL